MNLLERRVLQQIHQVPHTAKHLFLFELALVFLEHLWGSLCINDQAMYTLHVYGVIFLECGKHFSHKHTRSFQIEISNKYHGWFQFEATV
jgi:hypothetical protein